MSEGFRRAKIVCTVGPATRDEDVFRRMVSSGTDAVRINFSHAAHEEAGRFISMARDQARRTGRPLAVIADLQGPRIRVGDLSAVLMLRAGERYWIGPEGAAPPDGVEPDHIVPTTYPALAEDVHPEDRILLDDGRLELLVEEVRKPWVAGLSRTDGPLASQKGINLPGVTVQAPSLTEKDWEDLRFARTHHLDYFALSFVRRPEDVREARRAIDAGSLLIAKIEKDQALQHLDEIIRLADGVMVARGDLGVELPYEEVPMTQKHIIRQAQELARPVITATQMLDSMQTQRRPTRAEVSDVANALLDGTDAVMLSAETAVGSYPVEAVETLDRIIRRIEMERPGMFSRAPERPIEERAEVQQTTSGAIAAASLQAVERLGSPFLVTFTRSGFTARVVSAQRLPVPIMAVTDQWRTFNQLALVWGVHPVLFRGEVSYKSMLERARREALERKFGEPGVRFVVTAGVPFHTPGTTNMMRIEEL